MYVQRTFNCMRLILCVYFLVLLWNLLSHKIIYPVVKVTSMYKSHIPFPCYNYNLLQHEKSSCFMQYTYGNSPSYMLVPEYFTVSCYYSRLSLIRSPLGGQCSLAVIARWPHFRKQPRLKNDLTSNLMTNFCGSCLEDMKDNESFCSLFKCNPILSAKPHPKRHIRPQ